MAPIRLPIRAVIFFGLLIMYNYVYPKENFKFWCTVLFAITFTAETLIVMLLTLYNDIDIKIYSNAKLEREMDERKSTKLNSKFEDIYEKLKIMDAKMTKTFTRSFTLLKINVDHKDDNTLYTFLRQPMDEKELKLFHDFMVENKFTQYTEFIEESQRHTGMKFKDIEYAREYFHLYNCVRLPDDQLSEELQYKFSKLLITDNIEFMRKNVGDGSCYLESVDEYLSILFSYMSHKKNQHVTGYNIIGNLRQNGEYTIKLNVKYEICHSSSYWYYHKSNDCPWNFKEEPEFVATCVNDVSTVYGGKIKPLYRVKVKSNKENSMCGIFCEDISCSCDNDELV